MTASRTWHDYAFLLDSLVDPPMLAAAIARAADLGVEPHDVLLSSAAVTPQAYVEAVASQIGVAALRPGQPPLAPTALVDGTALGPRLLAVMAYDHASRGAAMALATPDVMDSLESRELRGKRLDQAVGGLRQLDPALSADGSIYLWQQLALLVVLGLMLGGGAIAPDTTCLVLMTGLSVPFFLVVLFRMIVLATVLSGDAAGGAINRNRQSDAELPHYALLVPLFRETAVLPDLVEALCRIDYPAAKLDCILILEASDRQTIALARSLILPPFMRIVVVPDCAPRTKPKALNYALQLARGDLVAVFDAEDVPDPQQLRKAVQAFEVGGPGVVCVQARLAIHNARANWLTRQFALEYAALFEGLLPALVRFRLPVPLGGTSNHFRRTFLQASGAWDPHNVTEDADLGMRIARRGGRIMMIRSFTWEEAPSRLAPWMKQRTRWLKGWMQTYLVHSRNPAQLARSLGVTGFLAFQALIGGVLLSSLLHPLFYIWMGWELWRGNFLAGSTGALEQGLLILAGFNLIAGFASSMAVAAVAAARTGKPSLSPHVVTMPIYWLLACWAAWRAVIQLVIAPHFWEKTEHAARRHSGIAAANRR
jgi:glycosyltransferase XagB